ncbi:ATP-binding protein [Glutamicibacter protophormiae]|uniref:ATP-binding protein n=1 Tax=Glutamicibacter protophormiae TaxID=37930 RepID=UPI00331A61EF
MVRRIQLIHLTVVGKGLPPATIEFGEKLTVIHGASDTGKSHIFDLIRYAFGLDKSINIPEEGKGYQYVHLGLAVDNENVFTLIRDFTGGRIGVVDGDVRELLTQPPAESLDPKHISKDPNSASRRMLSLVGLDEMLVRKTQYNETRMLEWRDVIRLTAVDEEAIITKRSPIESGQYQHRPVETAIFRLFIQGNDDSGLIAIPKAAELKKISAHKLEVIDQLIENLKLELADSPTLEHLREQLGRLNSSMESTSVALNEVSTARDDLVARRSANANILALLVERHDEISSLGSRFALLHTQYDLDLARLEMLAQVTEVLAIGEDEACPFCGAKAEHQHWHDMDVNEGETAPFSVAVVSEQSKIIALRTELSQTISAIQTEKQEIEERRDSLLKENLLLTEEISQSDQEIRSFGVDLEPSLFTRSLVEQKINTHLRLQELLALRIDTAQVDKPKTSTKVPISTSDLNQFDRIAEEILGLWSFPIGHSAYYSVAARDMVVDQRPRNTRGKGVRSILHALFNVSLAEYCLRRDFKHPGFVILDSPIVSYRQAGDPQLTGEDETISTNVVDAFYAYLQNNFSGQSLILENKSPYSPLPEGSREYFFSGSNSNINRAGFYPAKVNNEG